MFRFDAGPTIGGGHAVRCLTLAGALRAEGWRCKIITTDEGSGIIHDFPDRSAEVFSVPKAAALETDPVLAASAEGCDLMVIDHYGWSANQEARCRGWARRLFVIDDLCNRPHDCDLLLDPSLGRTTDEYGRFIPNHCRLLLNPGYALLRPEFASLRLRGTSTSAPHMPGRCFLNFGLLDEANLTARTLTVLDQIKFDGIIDVVMGASSSHIEEVRRYLAASMLRSVLHVNPPNLAELMAEANLAIGAGGGSTWERCCLGVPALVLLTAQNQSHNVRSIVDAGAGDWVALDEADAFAKRFTDLMQNLEKLAKMSSAARRVTDGLGARRAAIATAPEKARDGGNVGLRRAMFSDAKMMLAWQRHPLTRRYARNARVPIAAEHREWLIRKLSDPGCVINIIEHQGKPAGVLRLDRVRDRVNALAFEISISLDPDMTGRGVGQAALNAARRLLPEATLLAQVLAENQASHSLFKAAGFRLENDFYVQDPDAGPPPEVSPGSTPVDPLR